MLKTDLHLHTREDPKDIIKYSAKQLINYMAKKGYDVIAITPHLRPMKEDFFNELKDYAKRKGILLIKGTEIKIKGKEVLVYNYDKPIKRFSDLKKVRNENGLVIAPHPFYGTRQCLGKELIKNIKYFDAIEYCHFYTKSLNKPNRTARRTAKKYGKTLIGNSDAHNYYQTGHTYSEIMADKNTESVFEAIRKNRLRIVTKPLTKHMFARIFIKSIIPTPIQKLYKNTNKE
jgi:hypothetical protein